ncbi:GNAT family N-acetyltransferase [candidate division WOR-3 bacterium]|uniref:GNAT family N-acetyltransferase n=1 Tax=candidate division WOR-3 bacterium TaxID=2052148 RepID=A0A9D5K8H5_UNCW3|nr:GNAT family N-acetyltransferase [candidate division WOR-3 bacterium]MBD3364247.1 GNAT family N-acetyltransferase [candidate division WOR-3 bacterium]
MLYTNKNIKALRAPLPFLDEKWASFLGCSTSQLRDGKNHVVTRPKKASVRQSPWPLREGPIAVLTLGRGWVMSVPENLTDTTRSLCLNKSFTELLDDGDRLSQEWFDRGADHSKERGDCGYATMNRLAQGLRLRGWSHYIISYCDFGSFPAESDEHVVKITRDLADVWKQWQVWPGPMVGPVVCEHFPICDAFGCVLDGKLVSAAQLEAHPDEFAWEAGVDTLPEYRGRGFATQVLKTVTAFIILEGKIPWHYTDLYNRPSRRLPEHLGYFKYAEGLFSHMKK